MRVLTVKDFSCISQATLELSKFTIIIGPQASGKSVLCKLVYFFFDVAQTQATAIAEKVPYEKFLERLKLRFIEWFPLSAWGAKQFRIEFAAGKYRLILSRKIYGKRVLEDMNIRVDPQHREQYEQLIKNFARLGDVANDPKGIDLDELFDLEWNVRTASRDSLTKLMGDDATSQQIFIPAGRSFFTNIGKTIAVFEGARSIDPLIPVFGKIFLSYLGRGLLSTRKSTSLARRELAPILGELLGGVYRREGEREFVETSDGRQVPLSALSSGQQELLPLITVLPHLAGAFSRAGLCYLEEPEAHLFPASQSKLIEALVIATGRGHGTDLVITTHSPYVVTKVNNLLKAGAIGERIADSRRRELERIVQRRAWLTIDKVNAYALQDGALREIRNLEEGLIDGEYLDDVSSHLSEEFEKLLELEESIAA